jgi:hypothetical protein
MEIVGSSFCIIEAGVWGKNQIFMVGKEQEICSSLDMVVARVDYSPEATE